MPWRVLTCFAADYNASAISRRSQWQHSGRLASLSLYRIYQSKVRFNSHLKNNGELKQSVAPSPTSSSSSSSSSLSGAASPSYAPSTFYGIDHPYITGSSNSSCTYNRNMNGLHTYVPKPMELRVGSSNKNGHGNGEIKNTAGEKEEAQHEQEEEDPMASPGCSRGMLREAMLFIDDTVNITTTGTATVNTTANVNTNTPTTAGGFPPPPPALSLSRLKLLSLSLHIERNIFFYTETNPHTGMVFNIKEALFNHFQMVGAVKDAWSSVLSVDGELLDLLMTHTHIAKPGSVVHLLETLESKQDLSCCKYRSSVKQGNLMQFRYSQLTAAELAALQVLAQYAFLRYELI